MRILVTGGAGFIGSHLCDVLIGQGHDVVCMDNLFTSRRTNLSKVMTHSRFEFWRWDVCDPWHIECDRIYHLACPASPVQYQRNPVRTIKTAAIGTLNALECARDARARLLIASTSEVYGDPEVHPQKEDYHGNVNPLGDRACYDEGKRVGEALASSWTKQYGTDARIARIFNTYGPRMASDDGRMIPNFILQALGGKPLTIYGDGSQTRSWCYVKDTVAGLMNLMEVDLEIPDIPVVMNIGNPDERSVLKTASDIIEAVGCEFSVDHQELPQDDPQQRCPDITRAKSLLRWEPRIPFEEGIGYTVEWFRHGPRNEGSF
jgi:UDP-glucuronate decarboxylase